MKRPLFAALPLLLSVAAGAHAEIPVEERSLSGAAPVVAAKAPLASTPIGAPAADPNAAGSNTAWEQYTEQQQLRKELEQLRGAVEQQGFLIEKLQNDLRLRYTDLDQRLSAQQELLNQSAAGGAAAPLLPGPGATAPGATGPGATPAGAAAPVPTGAGIEEEKRAYLAAYDTFRSGGADKAIPPMLAFVKRFPHSPLIPGAYYLLGEFYLNAKTPDPGAALKQYETVVTEFPSNPKAPASLYRIASILDMSGKPAEAKQKMRELKARYPDSPEAGLADHYLKAVEAASAPAPEKPKAGSKSAAAKKPARHTTSKR
ncbi:MAG: tetratricopeptide repeat protein [Pseudomonadota bacterium]